jgi:N-acetylmuramoyl-L-alanine amidase
MIIIDRTAEASRVTITRNGRHIYSHGNVGARRSLSMIDGIILHHANFFSSDVERFDSVIANYIVMVDGRVLHVRPLSAALNSVGTDHRAIDIEFVGVYPGAGGARPPAAQLAAGRQLVAHLCGANPSLRRIYAHRHFRDKPCCGPHIWFNVGCWARQRGMNSDGATQTLPTEWEAASLALAAGIGGDIVDPWTGAVSPDIRDPWR